MLLPSGLENRCQVLAQVTLGEILSSSEKRVFNCINSKPLDIMILSPYAYPIASEYQGKSHHLG